jgi:hypothetical protein
MKRVLITTIILLFTVTICCSCGSNMKKRQDNIPVAKAVPAFNADSSWHFTEAQTKFGPRVPNTKAHEACRKYLVTTLKKFGATVIEQSADLKACDGKILKSTNIVASYNPEITNRILICAHWDSRPWSDQDKDKGNWYKPVMGANDGASGVGILMEIARVIGIEKMSKGNLPQIGVDLILFDSEDYGNPSFFEGKKDDLSWCLGSQYWAKNPHVQGYKARYGILLDMVGGTAANFEWEYFSTKYAQNILELVWSKAESCGFSNYFKKSEGGAVDDDHLYINQLAKIPCIDIIDHDLTSESGFVPYWHTQNDTMDNIDKNTLNAVGVTLLQVIYSE